MATGRPSRPGYSARGEALTLGDGEALGLSEGEAEGVFRLLVDEGFAEGDDLGVVVFLVPLAVEDWVGMRVPTQPLPIARVSGNNKARNLKTARDTRVLPLGPISAMYHAKEGMYRDMKAARFP
jgi:hypothetical protein